jgi:hypothetical protein
MQWNYVVKKFQILFSFLLYLVIFSSMKNDFHTCSWNIKEFFFHIYAIENSSIVSMVTMQFAHDGKIKAFCPPYLVALSVLVFWLSVYIVTQELCNLHSHKKILTEKMADRIRSRSPEEYRFQVSLSVHFHSRSLMFTQRNRFRSHCASKGKIWHRVSS